VECKLKDVSEFTSGSNCPIVNLFSVNHRFNFINQTVLPSVSDMTNPYTEFNSFKSQANPLQRFAHIYQRSVLISSFHLRIDHPNIFLLADFETKYL
jgi:hypothetical protein